jgi:hypothetical protein
LKKILAAFSFVLLAGMANANTVTFNGYLPNNVNLTTISTDGLDFTQIGGGDLYVWSAGESPNDGGNAGLISALGKGVTISLTGGGAFTLNSIDQTISWYDSNPTEDVLVTGSLQGGGTVAENLVLEQGLQDFNLAGLSDVTSVNIADISAGTGYWLIGSVDYTLISNAGYATAPAVSEPGTLSLVGCGALAAFGFWRRKLTT